MVRTVHRLRVRRRLGGYGEASPCCCRRHDRAPAVPLIRSVLTKIARRCSGGCSTQLGNGLAEPFQRWFRRVVVADDAELVERAVLVAVGVAEGEGGRPPVPTTAARLRRRGTCSIRLLCRRGRAGTTASAAEADRRW